MLPLVVGITRGREHQEVIITTKQELGSLRLGEEDY